MKTLIITLFSALFLLPAFSKDKKVSIEEVPSELKSAFAKQFPQATSVEWEMEKNNKWEAEYKTNGVEYSVCYDANGKWIETEQEISMKDVPEIIKATLAKEFVGYKVEDPELSETASGKAYKFELEKGKVELEVSIDLTGKVLSQKEEDENE